MPYAVIGLITLALWVFCLVDVITTDEALVRNLPKLAWLLIVLLLAALGSVVWLVAGRPRAMPRSVSNTTYSEYDRPGRQVAQDSAGDEEFLRRCRERAQEQRDRARRLGDSP